MPGISQHTPRMKRILLLIPALLLGAGQAVAQPKANFEVLHKELGSILWKLPQTTSFKVTNRGDTTLVISNVYPSCGCTTVESTQKFNALGLGTPNEKAVCPVCRQGIFEMEEWNALEEGQSRDIDVALSLVEEQRTCTFSNLFSFVLCLFIIGFPFALSIMK